MDDISLNDSTNRHWRLLVGAIVLFVVLYHFTGSNWLLLILVPLVVGAFYGSWSGRAAIGAASILSGHASEKALGRWQGSYYSWNNQQVRVIESGDSVWVIDEDLLRAADMKLDLHLRRKLEISYAAGYGTIPGTRQKGFSEKGVFEFLDGKQDGNPEIVKLKLWFEREIFFPIRQKRTEQRANRFD
jgi:hypothetical protein